MTYSVVIPLYNHAHYIEAAVRSVQDQTVEPSEIIVIDDGSSDCGFESVLSLAKDDPRIVCWQQPNRGAHFTINAGLHRATSDVLTILNSDDIYAADRMERCLAKLAGNSEIGAVYSRLSSIDSSGKVVANDWYENACKSAGMYSDAAISLLDANLIMTTSNLVIRRSALEKTRYFSGLRYAHDLEFFVRFLRLGGKFECIDESLLQYRVHTGNTISEDHNKVRVEWAFVIAWHASQMVGSATTEKVQSELLGVIERHELGRLVQWMSWFCSRSIADGFLPFEHPEWGRFLEDALKLTQ